MSLIITFILLYFIAFAQNNSCGYYWGEYQRVFSGSQGEIFFAKQFSKKHCDCGWPHLRVKHTFPFNIDVRLDYTVSSCDDGSHRDTWYSWDGPPNINLSTTGSWEFSRNLPTVFAVEITYEQDGKRHKIVVNKRTGKNQHYINGKTEQEFLAQQKEDLKAETIKKQQSETERKNTIAENQKQKKSTEISGIENVDAQRNYNMTNQEAKRIETNEKKKAEWNNKADNYYNAANSESDKIYKAYLNAMGDNATIIADPSKAQQIKARSDAEVLAAKNDLINMVSGGLQSIFNSSSGQSAAPNNNQQKSSFNENKTINNSSNSNLTNQVYISENNYFSQRLSTTRENVNSMIHKLDDDNKSISSFSDAFVENVPSNKIDPAPSVNTNPSTIAIGSTNNSGNSTICDHIGNNGAYKDFLRWSYYEPTKEIIIEIITPGMIDPQKTYYPPEEARSIICNYLTKGTAEGNTNKNNGAMVDDSEYKNLENELIKKLEEFQSKVETGNLSEAEIQRYQIYFEKIKIKMDKMETQNANNNKNNQNPVRSPRPGYGGIGN